jgi:hypothetical protein
MSTTRIKDKVSQLVNSQLPEFIRSDYTTFVAFLEYYYQFLEQDQGALELVQNARQYSDIDKTTDSFVNYFLANYAKDLPVSLLVDKSLLIKRIKGLYAAKGSAMSIETLFKVLYDTTASTRHPYEFVLKPSDGRWNLRSSIRVLKTSGSTTDIVDRFITVTKNNIKYTAEVLRVKNLTTDLFEIFFYSKYDVPFDLDDTVSVSSASGVIFTGTVKPTLNRLSVTTGGTGFRAGQVFNVTIAGGVDTLVRIIRVSSTGAILKLKFLNYGYGFTEDLSIILSSLGGITGRGTNLSTTSGGFSESFELLKTHSIADADRYFDTDYVDPFTYSGEKPVNSVTTSQLLTPVDTSNDEDPNNAVITFNIGAVARYPGEYTSTAGFLSEPDVKIQDSKLYQPFAYQVLSELDITVFYDIVKKLVHQAGTNLFVNRVLTATADLAANVSVIFKQNVYAELNSVFTTLEDVAKFTSKIADADNTTIIENETFVLYKPIDPPDSITLTDNTPITTIKGLSDNNITSTDDGTFFTMNKVARIGLPHLITDVNRYFESDYVELVPFDYTGVEPSDDGILDGGTVYVTESLTDVFNKNITDNTNGFTESGNGILLNYTETIGPSGYFLEYYVGEELITIS